MQDSDKKKTCNIGNLVGVEYYVYIMLNNNDDYCLHNILYEAEIASYIIRSTEPGIKSLMEASYMFWDVRSTSAIFCFSLTLR